MTIKRIIDSTGLPKTRVELDGSNGDEKTIKAILKAATPQARIDALRKQAEMRPIADELEARLVDGEADSELLEKILVAEKDAYLLEERRLIVRDAKRQEGMKKERRPRITQWIEKELRRNLSASRIELWERAPDFITDIIGPDRFKRRVGNVRKKLKSAASK